MKSNIDKAINYLQLYRLDKNPDYLVMAHRAMKREAQDIRKLSLNSDGKRKKAKDTAISQAK